MAAPTIVLYYVFFMPMTINQVLQCVCFPTLLVASKLFELWVDVIQKKQEYLKESIIARRNKSRKRRTSVTNLTLKQATRLPKGVRTFFIVANILYVITWLAIVFSLSFLAPQNNICGNHED